MTDASLVQYIILAHVILVAIPEGSSTIDLRPVCWASCDLGNCGVTHSDPQSFIKCTWTLDSPLDAEKYNFSARIQNHKYGSGRVECVSSILACDNVTGFCYSTFFLSNCSLVGSTRDIIVFFVDGKRGDRQTHSGNVYIRSVCSQIKPDPPIITGIGPDRKGRNIHINVSSATCPPLDMQYRLKYTRTNGIVTRKETIESRSISLKDATRYIFTLESTKGGIIYSDPANGSYLTKPKKAVDNIDHHCASVSDGIGNLTIWWEKSGIIDHFELTLKEEGKNETVHKDRISRQLENQTQHKTVAQIPSDSSKMYVVYITAFNEAGRSDTYRNGISVHCRPPPEFRCWVKSKGLSWMEVEWDTENDRNLKFVVEFSRPDRGNVRSITLNSKQRTWNQTDLQECLEYKIVVTKQYFGESQPCSIKEFTRGSVPRNAPEVHVTAAARKLTIQIQQNGRDPALLCGEELGYLLRYWMDGDTKVQQMKIGKGVDKATLTHLKPNCRYIIEVTAFNNAGIGVNGSYTAYTSETAPDDPPEITRCTKSSKGLLIAWNPPLTSSLNGNVSHYRILVHAKQASDEKSIQEKGCHPHPKGYLCIYGSKCNSTTLVNITTATNVSISACAVNGTQCSKWSKMVDIEEEEESQSLILIILCAVCGLMLVLVGVIGMIFRCRAQGPQPTKPRLPPELQNEFEEELLQDKSRKSSRDLEKNV